MIPDKFPRAVRRRFERAIRKLDVAEAKALTRQYMDAQLPISDHAALAGLHKARAALISATPEEREVSREWLRRNGFRTFQGFGPINKKELN